MVLWNKKSPKNDGCGTPPKPESISAPRPLLNYHGAQKITLFCPGVTPRVQVPKYRVCRGFHIRNRNSGVVANALYLGTWTFTLRVSQQPRNEALLQLYSNCRATAFSCRVDQPPSCPGYALEHEVMDCC